MRFLTLICLALLPQLATAAAPVLFATPDYESAVTAEANDLLMIAGSGFQSGDRLVYEALSAAGTGAHPPIPTGAPEASRGVARTIQVGPGANAITVRLPGALRAREIYHLWIVTAQGEWSRPVTVNDPRPLWISPNLAYSTADLAGLHRRIRVIGRNLESPEGRHLLIRLSGPQTQQLNRIEPSEEAMQHYVAESELPARLLPGTYHVSVSRDGRSWSDMPDGDLEVAPDPAPLPEFNPADARFGACRPDDDQDDTLCLSRAVEAANVAGGGIVTLPAGRWIISPAALPAEARRDGFVLAPNVQFRGAGADKTTLVRHDAHTAPPPGAMLTVTGRNSIVGATFLDDERIRTPDDARTAIQLGVALPVGKTAPPIEDVTITNTVIRRVGRAVQGSARPMRHLFITHNEFAAYDNGLLLTGNRVIVEQQYRIDDSIIRDNHFIPGSYLDLTRKQGVIASQLGAAARLDFSDNTADGTDVSGLQSPDDVSGWRAGFFWNSDNSHERVLVAQNNLACAGDKIGDGEAIAFDGNGNTFGFEAAPTIRSAGPDSITVAGALQTSQFGRRVPADYYRDHWISVVEGTGLGQTRRITAYSVGKEGSVVTFKVAPRWDIPPAGGGRINLGRQFWQVYIVANRVEQGRPPCRKSNLSGPHGGQIGLWGPTADSLIDGNRQTDSDGIGFTQGYSAHTPSCPTCIGAGTFVTALEIKHNIVTGEYDWSSDCSKSGIGGVYGASPTPESPPPIESFGIVIAHNTITRADGLHGGAISLSRGWFAGPPPGKWPLIENLLVFQNEIADITGAAPVNKCRNSQSERVGIRLDEHVRDAVLDGNRCTHVDQFVEDLGKDNRRECSSSGMNSCECHGH